MAVEVEHIGLNHRRRAGTDGNAIATAIHGVVVHEVGANQDEARVALR